MAKVRPSTPRRTGALLPLARRGAPIAALTLMALLGSLFAPIVAWAQEAPAAPASESASEPIGATSASLLAGGASAPAPASVGGGADNPDNAKQALDPGPRGNAQRSYPLSLPTARGTAQPPSALRYDSTFGQGPFGFGWYLPLASVRRESNLSILSNQDPSTVVLRTGDGTRLKYLCTIESTGGCPANQRAPEPEPRFLPATVGWAYFRPEHGDLDARYFLSLPSQRTILVERRDGTITELGQPLDVPNDQSGDPDSTWFEDNGPGLLVTPKAGQYPMEYYIVREYGREAVDLSQAILKPKNYVRYVYKRAGTRRVPDPVILSDIYDSPVEGRNPLPLPREEYAHHTRFVTVRDDTDALGLHVVRIDVTSKPDGGFQTKRQNRVRHYLEQTHGAVEKGKTFLRSIQTEGSCGRVAEDDTFRLPATSCKRAPATTYQYAETNIVVSLPYVFPIRSRVPADQPLFGSKAEVGDFDGDGLPDVLDTTDTLLLHRQKTPGSFEDLRAPIFDPERLNGPVPFLDDPNILVGDFDGDGRMDLMQSLPDARDGKYYDRHFTLDALDDGTYRWHVRGTPRPSSTPRFDRRFQSYAVADLDGNGRQDILGSRVNQSGGDYIEGQAHFFFAGWRDALDPNWAKGTFFRIGHEECGRINANRIGCWVEPTPSGLAMPVDANGQLLANIGDPGVRVVDLDGDRKADLVQVVPGGIRYWKSTGREFSTEPTIFEGTTPWRERTEGVFLADVTFDGFPDVLAVQDGKLTIVRNTFGSYLETLSTTELPDACGRDVRLLETSMAVTVLARNCTTGELYAVKITRSSLPGLLTDVDDGAVITHLDYELRSFRVGTIPAATRKLKPRTKYQDVYAVTRRTDSNPIGAPFTQGGRTRTTTYAYEHAAFSEEPSRFLGFGVVQTTEKGARAEEDRVTTTRYFFGRCRAEVNEPFQQCADGGAEDPELDAQPAERRVTDGLGRVLEVKVYGYEVQHRFGGAVLAFAPSKADTFVYSGRSVPAGTSDTPFADVTVDGTAYTRHVSVPNGFDGHLRQTYDRGPYFELAATVDYGRVGVDEPIGYGSTLQPQGGFAFRPVESWVTPGDRQHVGMMYDANGRLRHKYHVLWNSQELRRFHELSTLNIAPSPATAEIDGRNLVESYTYDPWGNVSGIEKANGDCSWLDFDPSGRFPLQASVPAGEEPLSPGSHCKGGPYLVTTFGYDAVLGVRTRIESPDGSVSVEHPDEFGRIDAVYGSSLGERGSPAMTPRLQRTYFDAGPARRYKVVKTTSLQGSGTRAEWTYTDGFGDVQLVLTEADPAKGDAGAYVARGLSERDAFGRVVKAYAPWFTNITPDVVVPPSLVAAGSASTFERDTFGRVTRTTWPDGTTRSVTSYAGFSTSTFDGDAAASQRAPSTVYVDGHGRTIRSEVPTSERGVDVLLVTTLAYTSTGEVTRIERTKKGGVEAPWVRWMQYDSLGRMVLNVEPNAVVPFTPTPPSDAGGLATVPGWRYAYDTEGRLVGTSDPRGCGENRVYDAAGRLRGVDYSPCLDHHPLYSAPDAATGSGYEAWYAYDALPDSLATVFGVDAAAYARPGKLVATADRAQASLFGYDERGRKIEHRKLVAIAAQPMDDIARYATPGFSKTFAYDASDRLTGETTGATAPELRDPSSKSFLSYEHTKRGLVRSVGSSYGALVGRATYDAQGRAVETVYGDAAATTTTVGYNARELLARVQTKRTSLPPARTTPSPSEPTRQLVLEDLEVPAYDLRGNPKAIQDKRDPKAWPAGAKPVSRTYDYDAASRVTAVGYAYGDGDASWVSPYEHERSADGPSSSPGKPARDVDQPARPTRETFAYDVRGNVLSRSAPGTFFDRALPTTYLEPGTDQLTGAEAPPPAGVGLGPKMEAKYDDAGNLTELALRVAESGPLPQTQEGQLYRLRWDEAGRLVRVERYDVIPYPIPPLEKPLVLEYTYDGANNRVRKTRTNDDGLTAVHDLYVFPTLELRNASYDEGRDVYESDARTQVVLLGGLGRAFYKEAVLDGAPERHTHVFLTMRDHLGSATVTIDKETSEVVEAVSLLAFGATDSDYRPVRWAAFREDYRFTGKEEDLEVGLVYFGHRYYSPALGRFISPDPLAVHALGADLNAYAYVRGQVSTSIDPNGLKDESKPCVDAITPGCVSDPGIQYWPGIGFVDDTLYEVTVDGNGKSSSPFAGVTLGAMFAALGRGASAAYQSAGAAGRWAGQKAEEAVTFFRNPYVRQQLLIGSVIAVSIAAVLLTEGAAAPAAIAEVTAVLETEGAIVEGAAVAEAVVAEEVAVTAAAETAAAEGAGTVWNAVKATQPVWEGTAIPRSFELATESGSVWVHGNATEHLAEYATSMLGRGVATNLVNVATQAQIGSLQGAVNSALQAGITYGRMMNVGGWELMFGAPRAAGQLPALIHAMPF